MTKLLSRIRSAAGVSAPLACVLLFGLVLACVVLAPPAGAQQRGADTAVNPTASSVKEQQLLREMRIISGRGSIPDVKSYNIEQPAGREWRQFQEITLHWLGAIAILGMLGLLVLFYLIRGTVSLEHGRSWRTMVRFNVFERLVHWMTATCFVALALSGLNITFGKELLIPLIGEETFATWSQWAKYAHDYLSFPFTLGVAVILLMWLASNTPTRLDAKWLIQGGGLVGARHPPAQRFNAGQKMIYWIVVIGGATVATTGYLLMFPFYVTDIAGMQLAQIIHGVVAMLFVAVMLAHIYIGTIGMEGAFEGMWRGTVDFNWAKQHHSTWFEEKSVKAQASAPEGDMAPAE